MATPLTAKKARLSFSSVHDEFHHIKVNDKKKPGNLIDARRCKKCDFIFEHKASTVLKTHLERKHRDVYDRVVGMFKKCLVRRKEE